MPPMSYVAALPRLTTQPNRQPREKRRRIRRKKHRVSAQRARCLELTSGRLCWRPALRRPASMSEPRSSRPPWAPLSYYSHSSGCSRGCQTSKRTFSAAAISLLALSLSHSLSLLLSSAPSFFLAPPSPPPPLWCLFDRAVTGSKVAWSISLGVQFRASLSK